MLKKIPFHLILIPTYFVVALFAQNISEVFVEDITRPLLVVTAVALLGLGIFSIFIRNIRRNALIISTAFFFFFLYGLVYGVLKETAPTLARHRILLPLFLVVLGLIWWGFGRSKSDFSRLTMLFNLFGIILLLMPMLNIFYYLRAQSSPREELIENSLTVGKVVVNDDLPDVYYIIPDAYGRADQLFQDYGFDNTQFLDWLRAQGFYVADCARSSYAHTMLTLPSLMQMDYVEEFASPEQYYDGGTNDYIVHNVVRDQFEAMGYRVISFEDVHWDYQDADVFYEFEFSLTSPYLRPFESILVMNSMLRALVEFNQQTQDLFSQQLYSPVKEHYLRQKFILDTLEDEVIQMEGPKFVFAHVETPHGPFVFNEDGTFIEEDAYYRGKYFSAITAEYGNAGYIKQVQFMNKRMQEIIEKIMLESNGEAAIIIQADHSNDEFGEPAQRMKILYAVYLPGQDYQQYYPTTNSVNTFRLVFNALFEMDYEILEDYSYHSYRSDRYNWVEVAENASLCR